MTEATKHTTTFSVSPKTDWLGAKPPDGTPPALQAWSYEEAFCRNLGLITRAEQQALRNCRVAIAGLGGVGGVDLITLARLGIGNFTIADPDVFECSNFNRQYGARTTTVGASKAEVMAEAVLQINPDAHIRVFREAINSSNVGDFLDDADLLVDGIDAFEIDVRRRLFRLAAENGIFALGAGPVGFSTAWVVFDPYGMSYDRYFGFYDGMPDIDAFVAYITGMVPKGSQRHYMTLDYLNYSERYGPSVSLACQLSSAVVAAEALKILLNRGGVYCAPYYQQFDAYLGRFIRRRLLLGYRNPLQRLKRRWLHRQLDKMRDKS